MKKTTPVKQKVMGRPRTGTTPLMGFRADPVIRASIVRWAEKQPDMPTLSESIRRLVEIGLTVGSRAAPSHRLRAIRAHRAKELATKVIENIIDPAAPPEERAQRRRRLTKGPEEFREARVDRQKK
jgi:regulator of PEP synthase PpsR (kinase-PPPase family)